jgi:hypothetical protein
MLIMGNPLDDIRIDRTVIHEYELGKEPKDWEYWLTKTPEERWAAIELLRIVNYGYDPATARLQRLFKVVERGEG